MEENLNLEQAIEEAINKTDKLGNKPQVVVANNTTLRNDLMDVYNQLREGNIGLRQAREVANMAGKVTSSAKAQLEYNQVVGKPDAKIPFFED